MTMRYTNSNVEDLLRTEIPLLDKGFIKLIDYMGGDDDVAEAARVSYQHGTKTSRDNANLIKYLYRHQHTSPIEQCEIKLHIKCPLFIARQWLRHRTASCITGDTKISFDLPTGNNGKPWKHYSLTVKQLFSRFQPTNNKRPDKQRNAFYKRDKIQEMKLRYYDLQENVIRHTKVVDIWSNGVKDVYKITLMDGTSLSCTSDHRLFTNEGWVDAQTAYSNKLLIGVQKRKEKTTPRQIQHTNDELDNEIWKPILAYGDRYDVSSFGRVRSWYNQRNIHLTEPKQKLVTVDESGYNIVSLSKDGVSRVYKVSRLLLEAFLPLPTYEGLCTRHINSNSLDDKLENLAWGTYLENAQDKFITGCNQELSLVFVKISQFEYIGKEEVFDLEVEAESHNFFANNICVHNCNEMSGRYSEILDEFYIPECSEIRGQSIDNKQCSGDVIGGEAAGEAQDIILANAKRCYQDYQDLLKRGVAREKARMVLPQNMYTQFFWKIDLHNLLHFLALRVDSHAQYEIRVYAQAILDIVKVWCPAIYEAFVQYRQECVKFSKSETELLVNEGIIDKEKWSEFEKLNTCSKGERKEFVDKVNKLLV